jgi:hypothetical protein
VLSDSEEPPAFRETSTRTSLPPIKTTTLEG